MLHHPAAHSPHVLDLAVSDFAECDTDVCGIDGPDDLCDVCAKRKELDDLLAQHNLQRDPCAFDCYVERPCHRCQEAKEWLNLLYERRDRVALLLTALEELAAVFPNELRELLTKPVIEIILGDER